METQRRKGSASVITFIGGFLSALLLANPGYAQSYLTSTGSPNFAAPEPVELGSVDAANGNLHLSIPLGSYPQRGTNQPQAITLEYDSNIWVAQSAALGLEWEPYNAPAYTQWNGWYLSFDASDQSNSIVEQLCYTDASWADQSGTFHFFHLNESTNNTCPRSADAFATDSSGYHMYANAFGPMTVYAPDGTLAFSSQQTKDPQGHYIMSEDSNGNYLSTDSIVPAALYDTLGRKVAAQTSSFHPSGVTMMTSQGTSTWSITTASINVKTMFQQSGVQENPGMAIYVIRSLTLPDAAGSTYYFTYDCDESTSSACGSPSGRSAYYGELIGITLPTGGTVNYSYTVFSDAYSNKTEWVSSRSAANGFWSYTPQVLTTCSATQVNCQQQTTVSTSAGSTIYTFQLNNGAWPITTVRKDSSGSTLTTINNTWDMSQSCVLIGCHGASFIRLLTQQTVVSRPGGSLTKQVSYSYDSPQSGNQTAIKEWKYISGGSFPSVPDRATYISYLTTGTNNIDRPLSVTLCNNSGSSSACTGGGSVVSQTLYNYDSYGSGGLTSISGIAQHDDANFGSSYTTRGNMTSESRWVSGSTYLTTSYTYDTTGQVLTETDPALNVFHFGYADSFFTDGGNGTTPSAYTPTTPTNAYLTSVMDPVGTQTNGYYWGSGTVSTATDYNGASTYSHHQDGLDRQTEEIDPIGWKLATYSTATQSDMYSGVGDTSPSTGCSSCQHTQTISDSYGRTSSQILVNNPIGQVNVDNTYDSVGRLQTQSHPYSGTSDPNHVLETFGYDGLNRQISTTHSDGQGRRAEFGANIITLGGISSQQGSSSTFGYGYPQISTDESGLQHQEWVDGFGRIVEVDEPSTTTANYATTTVSITSGGGGEWETIDPCEPHSSCPQTIPNTGEIYLTVDGYTAGASYGPTGPYPAFTTAAAVASALAAVFESDPNSPVIASANGSSILLTAKGPGASGNLAFSSSATFNNGNCPPYNPCFGGAPFAVAPSSGSLSGGSGGVGSSPYYTNYIYDVANHLTQVTQGAQTRSFQYDGLGRKITEVTPEGGTVTYAYSVSGGGLCSGNSSNVCSRTDARGVVSTYTYDHANRLTGVSYTIPGGKGIASMPNVCTTAPNNTSANTCYYYDQGGAAAHALGQRTEMIDPTGSESYAHDADGRLTQLSKVISGQTYNIGYQYDPGGDVTQIVYPSGRIVYQAYNSIGQLCLISPSSSGCSGTSYYAGQFGYSSPGQMTGFSYGNGVAASLSYSAPRAQLSSLTYSMGSQTYFSLGYWYQQNSQNCPNGSVENNGLIQCITDSVAGGRTVNYSYDLLGRMTSAKTNGSSSYPQWGLSETYDRFGNRPSQTITAGSGPTTNLTFGANNQPNGYTFDASGNMTVEPLSPPNNMSYDGENRMTAFSGNGGAANYTYDGNGLRIVRSVQAGTTTVSIFSGSSVIAEYDNGAAPASPSREYVYNPAGGETTGLLAMISAGTTTYYHQDHLSVRLTTNGSGSIVTQQGTFPFGESWYSNLGPGDNWIFTSYDRDSVSGLDYALARYYDSRTGTFCSADPLAGSPGDPQSWNRYAYGRDDPIDISDPTGKSWWSDMLGVLFAPMTGGFSLFLDATYDNVQAVVNNQNPSLPFFFGASFGGFPGGSSGGVWNDKWSVPFGGLANGIQNAIGLPTMADIGPINNATVTVAKKICDTDVGDVGMWGGHLKLIVHITDDDSVAYNWQQDATTDKLTQEDKDLGRKPNVPFNDGAKDTHLYWDGYQQPRHFDVLPAFRSATFEDTPRRYGGTSFTWSGHLKLIGINQKGDRTVLWDAGTWTAGAKAPDGGKVNCDGVGAKQ